MLNSVTVTNYLGETVEIELRNPEKSGFLITNIDGIGAGNASINMTEMATIDGSVFNSAKLPARNIVIDLRFIDNEKRSIEDVRIDSYKFFPIKSEVVLLFNTDTYTLRTSGYVEKNEPNIFSKGEGTQISIMCPDPNLYLRNPATNYFNTVIPLFRFPFKGGLWISTSRPIQDLDGNNILDSNGNTIGDKKYTLTDKIQFGLIDLSQYRVLYYEGHTEVGINIHFHFLGDVINPTIYNITKAEKMTINSNLFEKLIGTGIKAKDDIYICTIRGKKTIQLLRNGQYTNILNCLDKNTDWITLIRGENALYVSADSGIENINLTVTNDVVYEGV